MKFSKAIGTGAVFLAGMTASYAQHDGRDDKQGDQKDEKRLKSGRVPGNQDKGVSRQQSTPQQTREQSKVSDEQARTWQQQRGWLQKGGWQAHDNWQQTRAQNWTAEHRPWEQRGGYGGRRIPQDRFDREFGKHHFFRIGTRPVMYQGYPRFDYAGFSFLLLDPYPEYWSSNWYTYDDVFIDYDRGYYLYSRGYPQVRLAVAVLE